MNRLNNVKLCRSCLSAIYSGFNIFETIYKFTMSPAKFDTEVLVSKIFEHFTGIHLNETDVTISKYLCLTCLERLFNAYEFLELCKTSDDELKENNNSIDTIKDVYSGDNFLLKVNDSDDRLMNNNDLGDSYSDINDADPDYEGSVELNNTVEEDEDISNSTEYVGKVFDCLKCNKVFVDSAQLRRHERVHEGNWSCTECDKVLATKYTFRHHMMLHTGKPFECKVCTKRFARVAELNRHTKIYHLKEKFYECDECPKRFYTKSHLTSHKLSHLNKKTKKGEETNQRPGTPHESAGDSHLNDENKTNLITCEIGSTFTIQTAELSSVESSSFNTTVQSDPNETQQIVIKKENLRSNTIWKYYRCKKCFKKFRHRNNYIRHLKMTTNCQADIKCRTNPQKCEYCPTISDNVIELRKHLELHLDQDPFRCKLCNKNYKTWAKFADHTRQIHLLKKKYDKPPRNHLCTVCGRGLPSAKLLEEHYFVHQGIRNYKCEYCDRAFYTKSGLKQHSAIHTRDGLQCSECGKILADKVSLRNHLTIHFGKKFKCTICEKLFPHVSALNRHVKVHRGERNFQCDQCSKRYICRGHLTEHIRKIHENPRILACEVCEMKFNHRGTLNKHIRLEHAEKPMFSCTECGKSFGRKSRLAEHHRKFHTMVNPENP